MIGYLIRRAAYGGARKSHDKGLLCNPWCEHNSKVYSFAHIAIALVSLLVLGVVLSLFVGSSQSPRANCPWPYHYNHSVQHCE